MNQHPFLYQVVSEVQTGELTWSFEIYCCKICEYIYAITHTGLISGMKSNQRIMWITKRLIKKEPLRRPIMCACVCLCFSLALFTSVKTVSMLIILSQICSSELFVILNDKRKLNKDKTPLGIPKHLAYAVPWQNVMDKYFMMTHMGISCWRNSESLNISEINDQINLQMCHHTDSLINNE